MNELKSGFIAVVGRPNVGKSSLVNALVGGKVAIVTNKPQTTRNRIMGVVNGDDYQMVLVDTPGIQKARNKLGRYMEGAVSAAMDDVDLALVIIDAEAGLGARDEDALQRAIQSGATVVAVLNKADVADADKAARLADELSQRDGVSAVRIISALTGQGLKELLDILLDSLQPGPLYFPRDAVTDMPEEFMCAELVREKALLNLREEIPHGIGVELEKFMERDDGIVEIHAVIYCEKKSHKGIIIGKGGAMLKKIGTQARTEMEHIFDAKVYLELYVKIREDWRNAGRALRELGYDAND